MEALDIFSSRISVREYSDRSICKEDLMKIADAGRLAATARNEQPWEFVVVTDRKKVAELAGLTDTGKFLAGAGACRADFCWARNFFI